MIRNRYNQIPHPALKTKREITKYVHWWQFTKGTRKVTRMNSSFPNRWSFSYLKFKKYVINIIAEPKYKNGQQEQVTVRNHNRSTALKRSVLKYLGGGGGLNRFSCTQPRPQLLSWLKICSCSVRVNVSLLINGSSRETNKLQINTMLKQKWGRDRNVLRPTLGDPWGIEQHHWNTGANENQQLNPGGPTFCKNITFWFDMANFSHFVDGMQPGCFTTPRG